MSHHEVNDAAPALGTATLKPQPLQLKPLLPQALRPADLDVCTYLVDAGVGTTPADFDMRPDLLEDIADQLHRFDRINFYFREPLKFAEGLVVWVEPGMALVKILYEVDLYSRAADQEGVPHAFEVRQATPADGGQLGWLAIRRSDGVVLNANVFLGRRQDALRYLQQHNSAPAARRAA